MAAVNGRNEAVLLLLQHDADINIQNNVPVIIYNNSIFIIIIFIYMWYIYTVCITYNLIYI